MQENLKDILSGLSTSVDQEMLLQYLQGKLSEEKKHEVEKKMLEDSFNAEALEGLQQLSRNTDITLVVDQLNRDLRKRTSAKRKRIEKFRLKDQPWIYIAIFLIIALIAISYYIIYRLQNG